MPKPPRRPDPEPFEGDEVMTVAVGTAVWAVVFVVLLFFRADLQRHHTAWWLWVPAAGMWLGLLGLWLLMRRRRRLRSPAR